VTGIFLAVLSFYQRQVAVSARRNAVCGKRRFNPLLIRI
jgi:hypothetical protein